MCFTESALRIPIYEVKTHFKKDKAREQLSLVPAGLVDEEKSEISGQRGT